MSERGKSARAHLALYRKYRPRTLDEIIGQPQVTDILKPVADSGKFMHAYLFTGQRGTGKTSVARILARAINGTAYDTPDIDIIEIDAASNNGVDDVRELRDNINLAPMRSSHKIYIIDEVHMLSGAAFNALLKTLEEPPAHVVFILATTEIQKMPATILSRVQRFHFRPVAPEIVAGHLRTISDEEKIAVDDDALLLIAERGGGSFRDSITLLDQLSGGSDKITRGKVEEILGLAPETAIHEIIDAIDGRDATGVIATLAKLRADGVSSEIITGQLIAELLSAATMKPRLYELVEKLLDVAKSTAPDIKLTATLAGFATDGAPAKTMPQSVKSVATVVKAVAVEPPRNSLTEIVDVPVTEEKTVEKTSLTEKIMNENANPPDEIVWSDILGEVKNLDAPAVLSTLKFADFDYAGGALTLYFDRAFHRKSAEKANFRGTLNTAFENLYKFAPQIIIAKIAKPATESENSDIAQVAVIMGGGEIVKGAEV